MLTPPPPPPSVPIQQGRPPAGMIPAEAALLTLWVNEHYRDFDTISYNVRVGRGIDPGPTVDDFIRKMQIANSQRRIDALAQRGDVPLIIEVKVRATLQAIGQLLGYRALWLRDNPTGTFPDILLLCATIDPDTRFCMDALGVHFEVIGSGAAAIPLT